MMRTKYTKPIENLTPEDKDNFLDIVSVEVGNAAPGTGQTLANKLGEGDFYKERKRNDAVQENPTKKTIRDMLEEKWLKGEGSDVTIQRMVDVLTKIRLKQVVDKIKSEIPNSLEGELSDTVNVDPEREGRTAPQTVTNNTYNTFYNNINVIFHPDLAKNIEPGQIKFIEKLIKKQGLTTLDGFPGTEKSIIKFDTILTSVCMIEGGSQATGFIAKIPKHGVAFMTAGHCFEDKTAPPNVERLSENINFNDYLLHFGNSAGDPRKPETCKLGDLAPFRGSIGYKGKRRNFPGNLPDNGLQTEDYCVLLFDESKLRQFNLSYLECGEDDYLKYRPDGVVSIFGHPGRAPDSPGGTPGASCMEGLNDSCRPFRLSWGKEIQSSGNLAPEILLFDYDSLPGNSGSPVIGRGDAKGKYAVKGIHLGGITAGQENGAQSLLKLDSWIPVRGP